MTKIKIISILFCFLLLVTTVSAIDWDNKIYERQFTFDGKSIDNNELLQTYKPVEIKNLFGAGKTLMQGYLSHHTDYCDIDCSSTIEINLLEDGSLIDDVIFKNINGDLTTIRGYQFYIIKNGNKIPYKLGQVVKAGTYQVLLEGQKDFTQTVDWVILSHGEWIESWAWWDDVQYVFDEINDSSINTTLWSYTSGSSGGGTYANPTEGNDFINFNVNVDDNGEMAYVNLSSINVSDLNSINNLTLKLNIYRSHNEIYHTSTAYFRAFGNNIVTYDYSGSAGSYDANSTWIISRDSSGTNKFNIYMNGVFQGQINATNTLLNFRVYSSTSPSFHADGYIGMKLYYVYYSQNDTYPIILNSPIDGYDSPTQWISFNATGSSTVNLVNASLWTNITGTWGMTNYTTGLTTSKETVVIKGNITNYSIWNMQFCDAENGCIFAEENRTINPASDSIPPNVSITSPTTYVQRQIIDTNLTINWTVADPNIYICYYDYDGTNVSVPCLDNTTSILISDSNNRNITFWAIDSLGYVNSSFASWTYFVLEGGRTYETSTYETAAETFTINITANSSLTDVNLIHNTISHDTTKSGTIYTTTFDIPNSVGNKTFYWEFVYAGSTFNSNNYYQYVNNTLLGLCNDSLTVPYINFTFKDEETNLYMNATIDSSTWEYYLGSGTITKELLYSNTTVNDNYAFCFIASNDTMHNTRSVQYSSPGYPQRKYDASSDLTNATTNLTLYLLSSTDGIYTTIQVVDENGDRISGIEVIAERQFSGVWTVIGQEETDSAGSVTFWVNPDYDHRFTFAGDDCIGVTVTIRPTQTQYTQQLQCGVSEDIYVSAIEGIKYARNPLTGIIQDGTYNFSYQIYSSKDNIINASFYLVNASDGTVLNSSVSSCNPGGCTLWVMHVVNSGDYIKGRYYVDLGNGSILLEGDAWWKDINIPTGSSGVRTLFYDIIFVFQEWGEDSNTADFNRLLVIFFFMCISISMLNYHFNMDSMNPGMFLFIMTIFIIMGSIIGGTSPSVSNHGLFYYNNLVGSEFINNYILAILCVIMTVVYFINVNRQAQR